MGSIYHYSFKFNNVSNADFSKQSLEVLLSYMYTGVLVLRDPSQAVLLLQDALCLEISSVVTILQNYLKNHNLKLNKDQVGDRAVRFYYKICELV